MTVAFLENDVKNQLQKKRSSLLFYLVYFTNKEYYFPTGFLLNSEDGSLWSSVHQRADWYSAERYSAQVQMKGFITR